MSDHLPLSTTDKRCAQQLVEVATAENCSVSAVQPTRETMLAHFGAGQALMMAGDPQSAAAAVRELEEASALTRRMPPDPAVWMARPRLEGEEKLNPEMSYLSNRPRPKARTTFKQEWRLSSVTA